MTVTVSNTAFPNNIVLFLKTALRDAIDPPAPGESPPYPGIPVLTRPIRIGDPLQALSVVASLWTPETESAEMMGGVGISGAPLNNYLISVQSFVQHTSEEEGLSLCATLAGAVRNNLMLNSTIRAGLAVLTSTEFGFKESFKRGTVASQRFLSNEIDRQFYHLCNLDFVVETETQAF